MNIDKSKLKLRRETRWHREYAMDEPKRFFHESKFRDGSATITLAELEQEWPSWSDSERVDFCQEVCAAKCRELPDILRFVMARGEPQHWAGIALTMVHVLPADESIPFLLRAYSLSDLDHAANIVQALAKSGTPEAHKILRAHLERLWMHPDLFKEHKHINGIAGAAAHCLRHLLELGEPAEGFREKFEALTRHPNESNRKIAQNFLARHYVRG